MTHSERALDFELRVMRLMERALRTGILGVASSNAKLCHHKEYSSTERKSSIVFDIAVEVFRDGATEPFLLWIWECKNYGRSVPVDDVEEFHAKLQQIGSDRTKGTIASSSAFQRSAFEYAKSHGIGLVRVIEGNRLSFDLEDLGPLTEDQMELCLTTDNCPYVETDAVGVTARGGLVVGFSDLIWIETNC